METIWILIIAMGLGTHEVGLHNSKTDCVAAGEQAVGYRVVEDGSLVQGPVGFVCAPVEATK